MWKSRLFLIIFKITIPALNIFGGILAIHGIFRHIIRIRNSGGATLQRITKKRKYLITTQNAMMIGLEDTLTFEHFVQLFSRKFIK
jgi:hypothetical protein